MAALFCRLCQPETTSLLMKDIENTSSGEAKLHAELDKKDGYLESHEFNSTSLKQSRGRGASGSSSRSILQSVKAKAKKVYLPDAPSDVPICTISNNPGAVLVNGHADSCDDNKQLFGGASPLAPRHRSFSNYSPRAFLQRRKPKLELNFGGRTRSSPGFTKPSSNSQQPPPKHSELHLSSLKHFAGTSNFVLQKAPTRNKSSHSLASKPSFKTEQPPEEHQKGSSSSHHSSSTAATSNLDDEHELIAFCSALLQVSPPSVTQQDPTTSSAKQGFSTKASFGAQQFDTAKPFPPPPPPKVLMEQSHSFKFDLDALPPSSPPMIPANKPLSPILGSPFPSSQLSSPAPDYNLDDCNAPDDEQSNALPPNCATGGDCSAHRREKNNNLKLDRHRLCTSYRIYIPTLKNPVDACILPNGHFAIADYDNGFIVLSPNGDVLHHKDSSADKNACGIACVPDLPVRLFVLVFKDGAWSVNIYENYSLTETVCCPTDTQIESWALRKIGISSSKALHLMASGETKVTIWLYLLDTKSWTILASENSRRGGYNDISLRLDSSTPQTEVNVLLCDWRKSQLCTVVFSGEKYELVEQRSIKVRRVKGQEWVVQGPTLAVLDEQFDVLVYDGSGKLFFFDGDTNKCKKIVADLGRGEVSALFVKNGWIYVLCRYRLCLEIFLYKEFTETVL